MPKMEPIIVTSPEAMNRKKPVKLHGPPSPKLSLGEEAKLVFQEISPIPTKTPVSVLQELLCRRGKTPKYELVQIEGAIHEPIFRYRVFINSDYMATGTGRSKKDAKHAAAQKLLELLVGKITLEQANATNDSPGKTDTTTQVVSPYDDKVMGNPIGWLQEMCMSKRWPPPYYKMEHEEGLPHERQFTIACQVLKLKEIGTGKSKKLAKRMAAHKMWQALQDLPQEGSNSTLEEDNNLKQRPGAKLLELAAYPLSDKGLDCISFLSEIANEQEFEVTYVDIEEKTHSGKYQCLLQLSTLPVAVCYGCGSTVKDAQCKAAKNALEYLKIIILQ
ncbi:interferon-inducible double-stranded RNA-dependent protein kinase activator A homolog isoform X3 [Coccinella septempunctata]|uniref:interferon-inducible double-stranded RNA-dependent protein kinase activator A homolog isoform X3 n=1 Tax=Coccinella septempunctata TaxID=41139 RepID=UPI001D079C37|nr:interferon-inducible double-stranded RNA-dependent protein kinase activator A homolog isoform X3 [Coccinella septempunctata]